MKKYLGFILICISLTSIAIGQDNIITTDIDHFWRAFDGLQSQQTTADSLKTIKTIFVDPASEGLRQYMQAAGCNEKVYLETIRKRKADYLAVRAKTEGVAGRKPVLLQWLRRMKQLYPAMKIPVICFTIGKFEVGGTQFGNTLYIGCEKDLQTGIDIMVQAIHEVTHFQQKGQDPATNLELAMVEGGAEFICYQVTGQRTIPAAWKYGLAHEKNLVHEFRPRADSAINMKWFLDAPDRQENRPGSLGYFIGYRVCEAYLKRHSGKNQALKDLFEMENPKRIFKESLYGQ